MSRWPCRRQTSYPAAPSWHDHGELEADGLFEVGDPPAVVLQECRRRIDRQAMPQEHANLLAVTQVLTQLRHNEPQLLSLLGGKKTMIESPLIQELMAKKATQTMQNDIAAVLEERFGSVPEDVVAALSLVLGEDHLRRLIKQAARCGDLDAFRAALSSATTAPAERQPRRSGRSRR